MRLYAADQTHLLYAEVGLPELARHLIDSHFEPSFIDVNGMLRDVTSDICHGLLEIARQDIGTLPNPRLLDSMSFYDVLRDIRRH